MQPFPPYSVCMSVYKNDNAMHFLTALRSMFQQTIPPNEIVLVIDGPIGAELQNLIFEYESKQKGLFHVVPLTQNKGLGNALRIAVECAQYEYIARMDSDDIALPNRMELQLRYMQDHPECDIVGGQIEEFIDRPSNIVGKRIVPLLNKDLHQFLKSKCPFNHVTVMFKKSTVMKVGNYLDWHYNEDYYLWIRMALLRCNFANLSETLVYVRVGKEMYQRRGGWKYFKSERGIQRYMWQHQLISFPRYCYNVFIRFVVQVVMPNQMRGWVFQKFARE